MPRLGAGKLPIIYPLSLGSLPVPVHRVSYAGDVQLRGAVHDGGEGKALRRRRKLGEDYDNGRAEVGYSIPWVQSVAMTTSSLATYLRRRPGSRRVNRQ